MSLIRQILDGATDSKIDIASVLRKCKILAARLKSAEFAEWVDRELNGYSERSDLPSYRLLNVSAKAHLVDKWRRTQMPDAPVMSSLIPEQFRDWATKAYLNAPISAYASLLDGDELNEEISVEWPQEVAVNFGAAGYARDFQCIGARQVVTRGQIVALIDTIRNRIVDFVLKIEEMAPDAGEAAPGSEPIPQEKVTQVFNMYVSGGTNVISAAGSNNQATQTNIGALEPLLANLRKLELPEGSVDELKTDLDSGADPQTVAQKWIGRLALSGATAVTTKTIELAAKAISAHFGWQI